MMTNSADVSKANRDKKHRVVPSRNGSSSVPPKTELRGASIDDLEHRLGAIEGVNPDLATFVAHNWQRFVGALVVVLLVVVLYYQYKGAQDARGSEASQRFELASKAYEDLTAKTASPELVKPGEPPAADPKASSAEALSEQLRSLQSSHGETIYGKLASLYAAQVALDRENAQGAVDALAKFRTDKYASANAAKSSRAASDSALLDEIAALQQGRMLISDAQQRGQGRKVLAGLTLNGRFLNLESLLVLFRTSRTPEERKEAEDTTRKLLAARPELTELVTSQLGSVGLAVPEPS